MASSPNSRARRVSGGRRRSIVIPMPDAQSPVVVDVPENESTREMTIQEKIADLKAKMGLLDAYEEKISAECETWDRLLSQYKNAVLKEAEAPAETDENVEVDIGVRPRYITDPVREAYMRKLEDTAKANEKKVNQAYQELTKADKLRDEEEKKNRALAKIHKEGHSTEYLEKKIDTSKKLSEFIHKNEQETADFLKSVGVDYVPFEGIVPK